MAWCILKKGLFSLREADKFFKKIIIHLSTPFRILASGKRARRILFIRPEVQTKKFGNFADQPS